MAKAKSKSRPKSKSKSSAKGVAREAKVSRAKVKKQISEAREEQEILASVSDAGRHLADGKAAGKAARKRVPRSSLATLELPEDRPDPVDILEAQAASRVPALIPLRYGRMLVSAFTFYRGAAGIMAADLARSPVTGMRVQACGDAHLSNFGAFASPERRLVFDINDFDETLPGPWEWDVKRLAASFEIGARDRGFSEDERRQIVLGTARQYREAMAQFASMGNLDVWNWHLDVLDFFERFSEEADKAERKNLERNVAKAKGKDRLKAFSKLTHVVDGHLRIINDPPSVVPLDHIVPPDEAAELTRRVLEILASYRLSLSPDKRVLFDTYEYVHSAMKVVGVGSVGTRAWIVLMVGRDTGDPLFLQLKEAQESVLEPYAGSSRYSKHGRRVVEGQRLTQTSSDIFLGWTTVRGFDDVERDFYVRQLWDWKGSAHVEKMSVRAMSIYGRICGTVLARAHARTGNRFALASYLGTSDTFDRAIAEFSVAYADLNEHDYQALLDARDSGRIEVEEPEG
jgi:uncharacterized protein (DUF2252 family)